MALWPFGRKSKKNANTTAPSAPNGAFERGKSQRYVSSGAMSNPTKSSARTEPRQRASTRSLRSAGAFANGRNGTPSPHSSHHSRTGRPVSRGISTDAPGKSRSTSRKLSKTNNRHAGRDSVPPVPRIPSSAIAPPPDGEANKRNSLIEKSLIRRQSSRKKKAEQRVREDEVRAMSSPMPCLSTERGRPLSNVSLPIGSKDDTQRSFKINALDALAPRPTIRLAGGEFAPGASLQHDHKDVIMIDDLDRRELRGRIDNLADDMDAGSLREMMERDRRRQLRTEHERVQRRHQRMANRQLAKDGRTTLESSILRRQAGSIREGTRTPESWLKDPSAEHLPIQRDDSRDYSQNADGYHDTSVRSHQLQERREPQQDGQRTSVVLPNANTPKDARLHTHAYSPTPDSEPLGSSTSLTSSSRPSHDYTDRPQAKRFSSNWRSMFRRSELQQVPDQGPMTPPAFPNASRESVGRPAFVASHHRLSAVRSSTPSMRTQSIFREDLPDAPASPRILSPTNSKSRMLLQNGDLSRNTSLRAGGSTDASQSMHLSESLASVDAEGSWLAQKPIIRRPSSAMASRAEDEVDEDDQSGYGTPPAERYMGSLTPAFNDRSNQEASAAPTLDSRTQSPIPVHARRPLIQEVTHFESADDANGGTTWHSAVGRQPTIVQARDGQSRNPKDYFGVVGSSPIAAPRSAEILDVMSPSRASSPGSDIATGPALPSGLTNEGSDG